MKYTLGVMTEQTRSISYSLYGLFINYGPNPAINQNQKLVSG